MNLVELKEKVDSTIEQLKAEEKDPADIVVQGNLLFSAELGFTTEGGKSFASRTTEIEMNKLEIQDTDYDGGDAFYLNMREE